MTLARRAFLQHSGAAVALLSPAAHAYDAMLLSERVRRAQRSGAERAWAQFRQAFVNREGRVVDTGNRNISHSEGQGVAMLAAALTGDERSFNLLWRWTRETLLREDALLSWKYESGKGVTDRNNASDGELYVLWALHVAGQMFSRPALFAEGARIARALRETCVVETPRHGTMLLPGQHGFVARLADQTPDIAINLAYWVFPALASAQALDPSPAWARLRDNGLEMMRHARFGRHELPPDWLRLTDPVMPWPERPARFGWEAIRIPLFLYWAGHLQHPVLARFARFAAQPGFPAWVDFNDRARSDYPGPAGFEAIARLARHATFAQPFELPPLDKDYFSSSLTLMAHLAHLARQPAPQG